MKNLYICFVLCALSLLCASCSELGDAVTLTVLEPKTGTPVVDVFFHHERPNTFFTKLLNPIGAAYSSHSRVSKVNVNEKGEAIFSKMPKNAYFLTAGHYYNPGTSSKTEIARLLSKTERSLDVVIKTKRETKRVTVALKNSFRMGCPSEEYFYCEFCFLFRRERE